MQFSVNNPTQPTDEEMRKEQTYCGS